MALTMSQQDWIPANDWTFHMSWLELGVIFILGLALILAVLIIRLRINNDHKAIAWKNMEAKWSQLVPEVLEGRLAREQLWKQVPSHEELFFVDYLYRLACQMPVRKLDSPQYYQLVHLADPYLQFVARRIRNKKSDSELRARAVATIGKLAPHTSMDLLEYALEDTSDRVAFTAMRALVDHDDPRCGQIITQVFSRFHNYNPEYVATLLSRLNPACAIHFMIKIIENPEASLWSRIVAVCAIEHWPCSAENIPSLKKVAKDAKQYPTLRALILRVLASWAAVPESRELIYEFASSDEEVMRAHAMFAIGRLKLTTEHELLELGLHDTARWVAIEAATASEHMDASSDNSHLRPRWYLQTLELSA